jgi:D-aminoacyl-tRNA deacylase
MRAVLQRVTSASVTVDSEVVSAISRGLVVLVGIGTGQRATLSIVLGFAHAAR